MAKVKTKIPSLLCTFSPKLCRSPARIFFYLLFLLLLLFHTVLFFSGTVSAVRLRRGPATTSLSLCCINTNNRFSEDSQSRRWQSPEEEDAEDPMCNFKEIGRGELEKEEKKKLLLANIFDKSGHGLELLRLLLLRLLLRSWPPFDMFIKKVKQAENQSISHLESKEFLPLLPKM